jgi:hypothetical protein
MQSAEHVTALYRIQPPLRLFQTSVQPLKHLAADGQAPSFHSRSLLGKRTTGQTSTDNFRKKECQAQTQPISFLYMKKVVLPRIARFCVAVLACQFFVIFAHAQNVGIGTFNNLVGKTLQQAPSPTPEPFIATVGGRNVLVEATPCPVPFFSAPTAGWEYDYHLIQMTGVQGLRLDVNEAHESFNFTLAATTALTLDYFHVWSDGSNDAGVSQTSNANGIKATFQRTVGTHWIFALPFVVQETDASGSSILGPNSSIADSYLLYPFVVFKTPLVTTPRLLLFSLSSGYRVVVTNTADIHPIAPDIDGWNGTFSALARLDYVLNGSVTLSSGATWNHLTNFNFPTVTPLPDDNAFALAANATFSFGQTPCSEGPPSPRFILIIGYQYDGFNRDYYSHTFTVAGNCRF